MFNFIKRYWKWSIFLLIIFGLVVFGRLKLENIDIGPLTFSVQGKANSISLKYDFLGGGCGKIDGEKYKCHFEGVIKNLAGERTSIVRMWLVVWKDKYHESVLRMGGYDAQGGPSSIEDMITHEQVYLPLAIDGKAARTLAISYEGISSGTQDDHLLTAAKPTRPGSIFYIPSYTYELVFEDVNENWFDQEGKPLNKKVIQNNWLKAN